METMKMEEPKSETTQLIEETDDLEDKRQCSNCCNFPLATYFIVVNEFCERFCYYGMRAVLVLYLTQYVHMHTANALALYHFWVVMTYMTPLIGGYIADSHLGKFVTITVLSTVYAIGALIMSLTALAPPNVIGPCFGLLLIAFGSGGIKSCTSALGGDQFPPGKTKLIDSFFSVFYFTINAGSVLSSILTPILRADVHCNGRNTCYPLAFGISSILMVIAIIVFIAGRKMYIIKKPAGNVTARFFTCSWHAFKTNWRLGKEVPKKHWMDHAADQYEQDEIEDFKSVIRIIVLFLPMTIFWSLYDQQGSRWTLQAAQLDGHIYKGLTILPDQMQALNSVMILLFIPLFESVFYPIVERCHIPNKPLRRMTAGLILTVISFLAAFALQMQIENSVTTPLKNGFSHLRLMSLQPGCSIQSTTLTNIYTNDAFTISKYHTIPSVPTTVGLKTVCADGSQYTIEGQFTFESKHDYILYTWVTNKKLKFQLLPSKNKKDRNGLALVRFLYLKSTISHGEIQFLSDSRIHHIVKLDQNLTESSGELVVTPYLKIHRNEYEIQFVQTNNLSIILGKTLIRSGEIKTLIPHQIKGNIWKLTSAVEIPGNTISLLWQIPQYIIITAAEVLVSITGLAFSYSEAPKSMKAIVSAVWLAYTGFGNLIVAIVAEINLMPRDSWNYLLFAAMCTVTTIIFVVLAYFYIPADNYRRRNETYDSVDQQKKE